MSYDAIKNDFCFFWNLFVFLFPFNDIKIIKNPVQTLLLVFYDARQSADCLASHQGDSDMKTAAEFVKRGG